MILPKFLIADNDDYPENTYIVHTEKPCFIVDVDTEEYKFLGDSVIDEVSIAKLISLALEFYEKELDRYDDEE